MWRRIQNIWHPDAFHYHHLIGKGKSFFEGWYFKLVEPDGQKPCAIIPGVFLGQDAHAFIQFLDGRAGKSWYHRYPLESFEAATGRFKVSIEKNTFGLQGIHLDIDSREPGQNQRILGTVNFHGLSPWPVTWYWPGVMGPYAFIPFMECNHGILSLDHPLSGELEVDGKKTSYDEGRGYMEKDWGRSFPEGYVWTQSNHFERPGICVTASVAVIPWLRGAFRGFLVGFLLDGALHRFTTYNGSRIEELSLTRTHLHLRIRNRTHRLTVDAEKAQGALLRAPYERDMLERVAETMTSTVSVHLESLRSHETLFEGVGRHACMELQGNLQAILDKNHQ